MDNASPNRTSFTGPEDPAPKQNVELKARLADLDDARETAMRLATERPGVQIQVDTYFHCSQGRLKLREIDGQTAQLVWYSRPDETAAKLSSYGVIPVSNPVELKQALSAALGVRAIVDKRREIFMYENVRIHLDEVQGLGQFLEFEAVLGPEESPEAGHVKVDFLSRQFGIDASDLVPISYGDMTRSNAGDSD